MNHAQTEESIIDELYRVAESEPAFLSGEHVDNLEDWLQSSSLTRRASLTLLTRSFSDLQKDVRTNQEAAKALAGVFVLQDDLINCIKTLSDCIEKSQATLMLLLAEREDMRELIDQAKREQ